MDLKIIKILLGCPKGSARYLAGVEGFVEFALKKQAPRYQDLLSMS